MHKKSTVAAPGPDQVLQSPAADPKARDKDSQLAKSKRSRSIGRPSYLRKRAEEELRWSEERMRMILDSAAEGIFGIDAEGRCTFCNAASLRILGYAKESELLGQKMHALVVAKRADGAPYPMNEFPGLRSLESGTATWSDTDVFSRRDGTFFPVEYWSHPMFRYGKQIGAVITFLDITERKHAQESLRISEERFAKAFQASPEPIAIVRHRARTILEVNERWQSVFGYTRQEAVGRTATDLNHMEDGDRSRVRALLDKEHSIREFGVESRTKAGELRNIILSAEQIVINGELCDIYLCRDVTERTRAESQNRRLIHVLGQRIKELTVLHQAARFLQNENADIADLLREIVVHLPQAWQYPEITEARIRFGASEQATPGFVATPWMQCTSFRAAGMEGIIEVVYREQRPEEAEGPFLQEERSLLDSLAEMIRTSFDNRFAQNAVRESEERFRQLVDNIREVFWMNTPDFSTALYISPAYEKIWGRSREELYNNPRAFLEGIHEEDRPRVVEELERSVGCVFQLEYRVVRPDGSIRWIHDSGFPIHDANGRLYRIAGLAEDITERKEAEQQLLASREQLRALSAVLRNAKEEEGKRISRELHDELGGALTSIKWGLMAVRNRCTQNRTLHQGDVVREIEQMVGVVDATINTIRRISSELRPAVLDDLGLIPAIEWHARHFEANTGIVCRFDSQIEDVELDREQATPIFRIYQEAMTNILRHARASKINILIEQEENEFVLDISDNGRGIKDEETVGIRSLGLLGMRERAHSIQGKIKITSVAGKGTTVTLRAPI